METEKKAFTLQGKEELGVVEIASDVVASIAVLASLEVEGVASVAQGAANEFLSMVGVRIPGNKEARVEIEDNTARVDISLVMAYGFNIPETSQMVQDKIKCAIETMTGLEVSEVNIRIIGVNVK